MGNEKILKNRKKYLVIICIVVSVILILAGYCFLFIRDNESKLTDDSISGFIYDISNDYKKINTEDMIKEYHLQKIEKEIKSNENYFKKYAFVALNNDKITSIRQKLFDILKVIFDNIEYIDKEYLLQCLSELKVEYEKKVKYALAGEYDNETRTITLYNYDGNDVVTQNVIIYHELMHFIDMSTLPSLERKCKIYVAEGDTDDTIYTLEEIKKYGIDINKVDEYDAYGYVFEPGKGYDFLAEGGAEHYAYKYLADYSYVYGTYVMYIKILESILGEKEMKRIFFSPNSDYLLINKLMNMNFGSFNEIEKVFSSINMVDNGYNTYLGETTTKDRVDGIVSLCKLLRINWYEHIGLSFKINRYLEYYYELGWKEEIEESPYLEEYKKYYNHQESAVKDIEDQVYAMLLKENEIYETIGANWYVGIDEIYYLQIIKDQNDNVKTYKIKVDLDNSKITSIDIEDKN